MINDIQKSINSAAVKMEGGSKTVDAGVKSIEITGKVFNKINDEVINLKKLVEQVANDSINLNCKEKRAYSFINKMLAGKSK